MPHQAPEPKLSATVLIIRDRENLEVLMVKRHYEIDFAAGALVFPGGKAHDEDADPAWDELTDGDFGPVQQDARIAAVRETFEESGLILARPKAKRGTDAELVGADVAEALAPYRTAVDRREKSFLELMREHNLVLALDSLIPFGHWITPVMMPKRFDTHFYVAPAPKVQLASHDGREATDSMWVNADAALEMEKEGKATIIFPTRLNLRKLTRANSVMDAAKIFGVEEIITVLPEVTKDADGNPCLRIPEVLGYEQTIELMSNV